MRKNYVKKLFIFFLTFLFIQYGLVGVIGYYQSEPWPAFVFPGFKSVYVYEDGYEFSNVIFELYHEGRSEALSIKPQVFFPEIPTSQLSGFLRAHFSSEDRSLTFSDETRDWVMEKAAKFADGPVTDVQIVWQHNFYSSSASETSVDSTIVYKRFSLIRGGTENE